MNKKSKSNLQVFAGALITTMLASTVSHADQLSGTYNTGVSDVKESSTSLNIKFHVCDNDPALTCGTVVDVVNPDPENSTTMPDGSHVLGFLMVKDLKFKGDGKYRKGQINAIDESQKKNKMVWYKVKINVNDDRTIEVKGCLGPICPRTLVWKKISS